MRILVVDDQPQAVKRVATALESNGYDVLKAYGGIQGLDLARTKHPSLIILDLIMPDMSGMEVLTELKNRLGPSIELGILQIIVAVIISVPIGVVSAIRQDTWVDYVLRFFSVLGLAVPSFYLATLMLLFAFNWFNWAPPITTFHSFFHNPAENLKAMAIPALAGGIAHGLLFPAVVGGGSGVFPKQFRGTGTTLMLAMFDIGSLIGQPSVGSIIEISKSCRLPPYATMFTSVAMVTLLAAAFYAISTRDKAVAPED